MQDFIFDIIGLITDVSLGINYGFGHVLWGWAATACLFLGCLLLARGNCILGAIAIAGFVACSVCEWRRFKQDVWEKRKMDAEKKRTQES